MITNNVYVARMNQTNLDLGENALLHRDMVKQNSHQVEDVVQIFSIKLLTNNTYHPHHLPKTLFSYSANDFEKEANQNILSVWGQLIFRLWVTPHGMKNEKNPEKSISAAYI